MVWHSVSQLCLICVTMEVKYRSHHILNYSIYKPILAGGFTVRARAVRIRDRRDESSKSFSRSSWLTELDAIVLQDITDIRHIPSSVQKNMRQKWCYKTNYILPDVLPVKNDREYKQLACTGTQKVYSCCVCLSFS